jgi:3-oxoacyl-[acyl-carrier-protein] synthase II
MISGQRRVVITGMGMVLPLGNSKEELWDALTGGRSGVRVLSGQLAGVLPTTVAAPASQFQGEVEDFGPLDKEQKKAIRKGLKVMCRECQMGVAASQRALADAGLLPGKYDPLRTGIAFNSDYMITMPEEFIEPIRECVNGGGSFEFDRWAAAGLPKMSPLWLLKYLPNMPASHLAIYNDLQGPNNSLTLREAGANAAVAESLATILDGRADIMLCGATGTRLHPLKAIHAIQQEEVAVGNGDPAKASRPFDRNRRGMVLGEGAAAIILEELTSAQARGATIFGEVIAGASSLVADRRLLARRGLAMTNVLKMVVQRSGYTPDEIGHLHAHGLSTRTSDAEEAWAVNQVFADRRTPLPVTAAKSYFGNLGAGSGMAEIAASALALHTRRLFPVLNFETPDPDCPLAIVTQSCDPGDSFINLNVTPQGQATAILVRRFDG